jgi:hypothetical protein
MTVTKKFLCHKDRYSYKVKTMVKHNISGENNGDDPLKPTGTQL